MVPVVRTRLHVVDFSLSPEFSTTVHVYPHSAHATFTGAPLPQHLLLRVVGGKPMESPLQ